jgi:hypothetical protein
MNRSEIHLLSFYMAMIELYQNTRLLRYFVFLRPLLGLLLNPESDVGITSLAILIVKLILALETQRSVF